MERRTRSGWVAAILVAIAAIALGGNAAPAQEIAASPQQLTHDLVSLSLRYRAAPPRERARLRHELHSLAEARRKLLGALLESDPNAVMEVALPAGVRAGLPPALRRFVEGEADFEGELEVTVEDLPGASRTLHVLKTNAGRRLALHFAGGAPPLNTGSWVRVHGVRVQNALALTSGTTSFQALSAVVPNTFGAQKTAVILVNFQDTPTQPYTVATAENVVFATTSSFDLESSFQQTWLTGDVYGWYTLSMSSTVCDPNTLASGANAAATAAGVNLSAYTRYVYAFPKNACAWWGRGTIGGNPSQAWINGSLALKVVAHEMGHNFGLYHANTLSCPGMTIGTNCTVVEYGDTIDTMGQQGPGHFNAFQKERLGWLAYGTSPPITTVQTSGTYEIYPFEAGISNPKALKILQSTDPTTGAKTWYYVEFRQALGFDGFLSSNANVLNGIVVHTGSESSGNTSKMLDMTPATATFDDAALDLGLAFSDPNIGLTLIPLSVSSSRATVSVTLGPAACVPASPTVTISPSQAPSVAPGAAVSFTVSVKDNDSSGCPASTFNLQATAPSGWTASLAAPALTLSAGTTASTTLQVTSPGTAPDGSYTVGVSATNGANTSLTTSASATYVILSSSISSSVATDKSSYTRSELVSITTAVGMSGSPVAGAKVTVTVTRSDGSAVTMSGTTGSSGYVVLTLRLKKSNPTGAYRVAATASVPPTLSASASTSFTVR